MEGTRCPSCGETRWQLTSFSLTRAKQCPVCDTEVVPERRMPGRRRAAAQSGERRETDEIPAISADVVPPAAAAGQSA